MFSRHRFVDERGSVRKVSASCGQRFVADRRRTEMVKIDHNVNSVLGYRSSDNLYRTCSANKKYDHSIYFMTIGEIKNDKKNLREINDDSRKENLLMDIEVEEEKEEEEIKNENKDYKPTIVYNKIAFHQLFRRIKFVIYSKSYILPLFTRISLYYLLDYPLLPIA